MLPGRKVFGWAQLRVLLLAASLLISSVKALSYNFTDLPKCQYTTLQLQNLPATENPAPCIMYDTEPDILGSGSEPNATAYMILVTPSDCGQWRDGAKVAVDKLNGDNGGRGYAIGFYENYYVKFRYISVLGGNPNNPVLGNTGYTQRHEALLEALLEYTAGQIRYIIGTCSWLAETEKAPALKHEVVVAAQVGPPSFYNPRLNKWVFGFHVSSDDYPVASLRKLAFWARQQPGGLSSVPIRVIYRQATGGEFFRSTCDSALATIQVIGFTDVQRLLYDPVGDADGDGIENQKDEDFLIHEVADKVCPPGSAENLEFRPAMYICTRIEQDVILKRFRENGCLMTSLWITSASWIWAENEPNKNQVHYYQGGGQWHPSMKYSDDYFGSGVQVLEETASWTGYMGGYDQVVAYAIPVFYAQHLKHSYRVKDIPTPLQDFASADGREELRRRMLEMRVDTIFGTVQFDSKQRNIGRASAAAQWQPDPDAPAGSNALKYRLFSPDSQAETEVVLQADTGKGCPAGGFVNASVLLERVNLLESVCSQCPEGEYTPKASGALECLVCPDGTFTDGMGSANCTHLDDNLLSEGMLAFGYIVLAVSWAMAIVFIVWIIVYRKDPVVRLAQVPFLLLICIGGLISSSSILCITFQAGSNEDNSAATAGCKAAPILYCLGWVIQYGALCAKTKRLQRILEEGSSAQPTSQSQRRHAVLGAWTSAPVIVIPLILDAAILAAWTILEPLEYQREETGRSYENGVVAIESVGRCRPSGDEYDVWVFLGPLFAIHLILVLYTHWLLWKVRNVSNRYQEQKYLSMAAIFALEVAIVGIPILVAAQDSVEATFFVIVGIVGLDNTGVLGFVFVPKVFFQVKGLEEGVTVGESILAETHKLAVVRESNRIPSSAAMNSSNGMDGGSSLPQESSLSPAHSDSNFFPLTTIAESESSPNSHIDHTETKPNHEPSDRSEDPVPEHAPTTVFASSRAAQEEVIQSRNVPSAQPVIPEAPPSRVAGDSEYDLGDDMSLPDEPGGSNPQHFL